MEMLLNQKQVEVILNKKTALECLDCGNKLCTTDVMSMHCVSCKKEFNTNILSMFKSFKESEDYYVKEKLIATLVFTDELTSKHSGRYASYADNTARYKTYLSLLPLKFLQHFFAVRMSLLHDSVKT